MKNSNAMFTERFGSKRRPSLSPGTCNPGRRVSASGCGQVSWIRNGRLPRPKRRPTESDISCQVMFSEVWRLWQFPMSVGTTIEQ